MHEHEKGAAPGAAAAASCSAPLGCLGRGRAPSHPSVAAQAVSAACRAAVLTGHSELCVLIEV